MRETAIVAAIGLLLAAVPAASKQQQPASTGSESERAAPGGVAARDSDAPPGNPYLADSSWPMVHRSGYCQASSSWPGPRAEIPARPEDFVLNPNTGVFVFSGPYPDGGRVVWVGTASPPSRSGAPTRSPRRSWAGPGIR